MKVWQCNMQIDGRKLGLTFMLPPTRDDLYKVFEKEWLKLSSKDQDESWNWLLYVQLLPEIFEPDVPYVTIFGTFILREKEIIENHPNR